MSSNPAPVSMPLTIALISVVSIFYALFLYLITRGFRKRIFLKQMFRATHTVLNNDKDDDECIRQIELSYRKSSERYRTESSGLRSCVNVLEYFVHYYNVYGEKGFKNRFNLEVSVDMRNRVFTVIKKMRAQNPFASLDSKDANLLSTVQQAVAGGNTALATSALGRLAEEIEAKENVVRSQENRTRLSLIVALIGVVLTLLFGLVSFLPR